MNCEVCGCESPNSPCFDCWTDEQEIINGNIDKLKESNAALRSALEGLERSLMAVHVVGFIDGHDVIRRESVRDIIRTHLQN